MTCFPDSLICWQRLEKRNSSIKGHCSGRSTEPRHSSESLASPGRARKTGEIEARRAFVRSRRSFSSFCILPYYFKLRPAARAVRAGLAIHQHARRPPRRAGSVLPRMRTDFRRKFQIPSPRRIRPLAGKQTPKKLQIPNYKDALWSLCFQR